MRFVDKPVAKFFSIHESFEILNVLRCPDTACDDRAACDVSWQVQLILPSERLAGDRFSPLFFIEAHYG